MDARGVRIMVWNVHGFRSGVRRAVEAVAAELPDVLLLNEVRLRWRLQRFARWLGMEGVSGLRLMRPVTNAILVRPPWRVVEQWAAPLTRTRRLKRRGVVAVRAGSAGHRLTLACTHLGVSDPERIRHARELTDMLAGAPSPMVLGGDLNEGPDRPAVTWIAERYWDAFAERGEGPGETFPSTSPRARIDYLFASDGVRVERARVIDGLEARAASDHLPVVADLRLVPGEGSR